MDLPIVRARARHPHESLAASRRHDGSIDGYRRERRALASRAQSLPLDAAAGDGRRGQGRSQQ